MTVRCRKRIWLVALLALMTLAGCTRTAPEQRLRDALSSLPAAVQTRDTSALATWLADDFIGPDGLDRDGARRLAQMMFLRHREVVVVLGPPRISIDNAHASIQFTAALGGGTRALLPDAANVYDVDTAWRLERGDWRLISAQWKAQL